MNFNWVDFTILAIIAVSGVVSVSRGFVKELLSLVIWVAAIVTAWLFGASLSELFKDYIEVPSLRIILACALLFIATLMAGAVVNLLFSQLIKATGLTGTDRMLGVVFGVLRGLLIVVVLVGILGLAPVKNDAWWKESALLPKFEMLANWSQHNVVKWFTPLLQKA